MIQQHFYCPVCVGKRERERRERGGRERGREREIKGEREGERERERDRGTEGGRVRERDMQCHQRSEYRNFSVHFWIHTSEVIKMKTKSVHTCRQKKISYQRPLPKRPISENPNIYIVQYYTLYYSASKAQHTLAGNKGKICGSHPTSPSTPSPKECTALAKLQMHMKLYY